MTKQTFYADHFVQRSLAKIQAARVNVWQSGMNSDGQMIWWVSSATNPNRSYVVTQVGCRLVCECKAADEGLPCLHRVAVTDMLIRESEAIRQQEWADIHAALDKAAARIQARARQREAAKKQAV